MDKNECSQSVSIDFDTLKLVVNVIEAIETQERKNNVKIDAKYQAVKCYRNIFGTSSSFKLVVDFSWLRKNFTATIHPLVGTRSPTLFVGRTSEPATFKMCLNDKDQSEFVTFTSRDDHVTVFSPEVQEPIGRVVRRKAAKILNDESDIICYATDMKFIMKNFASDAISSNVPSMKIFDSNGRVLAAASVCRMVTTTSSITTSRDLSEFVLHFDDSISEPTKVMVLVAFSNWAKWSRCEADGRGPWRYFRIKFLLILFAFVAIVGLIQNVHHN